MLPQQHGKYSSRSSANLFPSAAVPSEVSTRKSMSNGDFYGNIPSSSVGSSSHSLLRSSNNNNSSSRTANGWRILKKDSDSEAPDDVLREGINQSPEHSSVLVDLQSPPNLHQGRLISPTDYTKDNPVSLKFNVVLSF